MTHSAREIVVTIPGLTLAAKAWGDPLGKKLLALHGWLDNAASFDPIAPFFVEKGYYFVALDFAGHGLSSHRAPGSYYHFVDNVADVVFFTTALGWERYTLIGHSMGANVATLLAGTVPDAIERLALIEGIGPFTTEAPNAPEQLKRAILQRTSKLSRGHKTFPSLEQAAERRKIGDPTGISLESARILVERNCMRIESSGEYTWRFDPQLQTASLVRFTEEQVHAFIEQVRCPTLVIEGESGWKFEKNVYRTRFDRFPNAKLVTLPGTHHLHMDNPNTVAEAILDFLLDHS